MGNPATVPNQDDLMSRLQSVSSLSQDTGSSGDDLMSRLNGVAGTTPVKMVGPKGEITSVPSNGVADARKKNFMVHPDNPGVQKFVTPKGQVAYALPSEIDTFKKGGSTLINADGTFRVEPLENEDNIDTMERAKKVMKAMTYEERRKAVDAEIHPFDPRPVSSGGSGVKGAGRLAIHGVVAPVAATTATMGTLVGGSEALAGLESAGSALANTEAGQLFSSSPRLYAQYLMKQGLKGVTQYALEHKLGTAIVMDQLAKALGIQKSTVLHKLLAAGGSAMAE